jgi:hypothetical protein
MRRRIVRYLPVIAMALLVQLLAPLGAVRSVAQAALDPLALATICSGVENQSQPHGGSTGPDVGDCCGFCGAGSAGNGGFAPTPQFQIVLQRRSAAIAWAPLEQPGSGPHRGSNAQARAPPAAVA